MSRWFPRLKWPPIFRPVLQQSRGNYCYRFQRETLGPGVARDIVACINRQNYYDDASGECHSVTLCPVMTGEHNEGQLAAEK